MSSKNPWHEQVEAVRAALEVRLDRVRDLALEALDPEGDKYERTLRGALTHELNELGVTIIAMVCPTLYEQLRGKAALLKIVESVSGQPPPRSFPLVPEKVTFEVACLVQDHRRWKSEAEAALVEVERLKLRIAELEESVADLADTTVAKAVH